MYYGFPIAPRNAFIRPSCLHRETVTHGQRKDQETDSQTKNTRMSCRQTKLLCNNLRAAIRETLPAPFSRPRYVLAIEEEGRERNVTQSGLADSDGGPPSSASLASADRTWRIGISSSWSDSFGYRSSRANIKCLFCGNWVSIDEK